MHLQPEQIEQLVQSFVIEYDLKVHRAAGKILRDPEAWRTVPELTAEEKLALEHENKNSFWRQPKALRMTIITLCVAAIVQGWNQTGTNGANLNWPQQLGLDHITGCDVTGKDAWIFSIVNAATYFAAALVGCWLSDPLNEYFFGRRSAIFVSACIILASVIGGACSHTWQELLACRVILGIGMGSKASVTPVFAAEIAPGHLRGSLVMNWQLFDAFGIFLGYTANVIVAGVGRTAWRWQIASSVLPTIVLLSMIWMCPESPRFLMKKGHYHSAYQSLLLLRLHPILAAKELFYVHCQMDVENRYLARSRGEDVEASLVSPCKTHDDSPGPLETANETVKSKIRESSRPDSSMVGTLLRRQPGRPINYWQKLHQLFTVKRNRRALLAAVVCMVSQQLCGVNALSFYSSTLFCAANDPSKADVSPGDSLTPLLLSWGIGLTNAVFALPAYFLIDRKGRRWLLLVTIPLMAVSMLAAGLSFLIPTSSGAHAPIIGIFTYIFMIFYSPGMGPVPFTLSAEVFPLDSRVVGMSFAVFTNLFGCGVLALVVPVLTAKIGHPGLLGIFAGLNVVAFFLVFFFVRETAGAAIGSSVSSCLSVSLEELNYLFGVSTRQHIKYQVGIVVPWAWRYYVRRDKDIPDQPDKLYTWYSTKEQEIRAATKTD
nr:putative polyol transporter 3 [Quercus suber]